MYKSFAKRSLVGAGYDADEGGCFGGSATGGEYTLSRAQQRGLGLVQVTQIIDIVCSEKSSIDITKSVIHLRDQC